MLSKLFDDRKCNTLAYSDEFLQAISYTRSKGFTPDTTVLSGGSMNAVRELLNELSEMIPKFIYEHPYEKYDCEAYGGDCGNIHLSVVHFIQNYYPSLPVNLCTGSLSKGKRILFEFDEAKSDLWFNGNKSDLHDCHTWITLGPQIVLDLTIGTYLNTRLSLFKSYHKKKNIFGGLTILQDGDYLWLPFNGFSQKKPRGLTKLNYRPVLIGCQANLSTEIYKNA